MRRRVREEVEIRARAGRRRARAPSGACATRTWCRERAASSGRHDVGVALDAIRRFELRRRARRTAAPAASRKSSSVFGALPAPPSDVISSAFDPTITGDVVVLSCRRRSCGSRPAAPSRRRSPASARSSPRSSSAGNARNAASEVAPSALRERDADVLRRLLRAAIVVRCGVRLKRPPLCPMARMNKPLASGDATSVFTLHEPADSPPIVTRDGSPPNAAMLRCTHCSAAI